MTRFKKLCSQSPLPKNHLKYDSEENKLILGESLVISPKLIIHDWLKNIHLGEASILLAVTFNRVYAG